MGPEDTKETDLLERIRAGDRSACDECIIEHAPGVFRLALRLVRNKAEAEDVMQETFLSAFRGIDRFDGRSSLRTWLYRIAYTTALDHLRRRGRRPEVVCEDPRQGDAGYAHDDSAERSSLRHAIARGLDALPVDQRLTLLLVDREDLTYREVAAIMDVSPGTVCSRLQRAREKLRESLREQGVRAGQAQAEEVQE